MDSKLSIVLFLYLIVGIRAEDCFRAAVYEHFQAGNETDSPSVIIDKNLNIFEEIAVIANKQDAKILVFPEDGIIHPDTYSRSQISKFAEELPDPKKVKYIACDDSNSNKQKPITYRLSCSAKTNGIYIVADYPERRLCNSTSDPKCPKDGNYLFNTAVAFGPDGSMVAKYHKMHLCGETYFNSAPEPEFVFFDTPFGRIGLFICFDIVFKKPGVELIEKYGIQTMAFPTWWFDGLPFITAEQIQEGWAVTNRVNLLAANSHVLRSRSTGSGIYSGQTGALVMSDALSKYDNLMIADIPIDSRNPSAKCLINRYNKTIINTKNYDPTSYNPNAEFNMEGASVVALTKPTDSVKVCNNGLCCRVNYSTSSDEEAFRDNEYRLIASNTTISRCGSTPINEELCGIFKCFDHNCKQVSINTNQYFNYMEISAQFSSQYNYPMINSNQLRVIDKQYWTLEKDNKNNFRVILNDYKRPVLSMALYGRRYNE